MEKQCHCQTINNISVKIKKLTTTATIPTRGSAAAAGYDLYADLGEETEIFIKPHETILVGTGLAFALPAGTYLGLYARSGLASKQGLRPANCVRNRRFRL